MAICLAESLLQNPPFNIADIQNKYLNWWRNDGFDSGEVNSKVFEYVGEGYNFAEAVKKADLELNGMTAGCNPVHRSAPLAMSKKLSDHDLRNFAVSEAVITHKHNHAAIVSSTAVQLIRMLIAGSSWESAIMKLENGSHPVILEALKQAKNGNIYYDGYSKHVLAASLYFVDNYSNFDDMLEKAIEFSGESNYCAVLAGSLGGARWGVCNISKFWLKGHKDQDRVMSIATALAEDW